MKLILPLVAAAALTLSGLSVVSSSAADGSSLVFSKCTPCHSLKRVCRGLGKKDLSVKIIKGRLNIKSEVETKWVKPFEKTFILPEESNSKKIKATVENGILSVNIPIREDAEKIVEVL